MKRISLFVAVAVLILSGYFWFDKTNEVSLPNSFSGIVTDVNLEAMAYDGPALVTMQTAVGETVIIAVPSMGLALCEAFENIAFVDVVAVGDTVSVTGERDEDGRVVPCNDISHHLTVTSKMLDRVYGFEFEYRKGPDGYITLEDNESTDSDFVTGIVLFNQKEYEDFRESTDPREGPPAIHVRVYRNPEKLSSFVWPERKPLESNIKRALGEIEEATVGGANASHYTVDGLYPIDTYVVASGEHIYVLMGAYLEVDSAIHKDFQALVDSFNFLQTEGQN